MWISGRPRLSAPSVPGGLGGAIAPGIGISTEALFTRAAKLPRVELVKPAGIIGRNTVSSMQAGIFYGFVGQVDEIVRRMKKELGEDTKVIATGGLAGLIAQESSVIERVEPLLTLIGLRLILRKESAALRIGTVQLENPVIAAPMAGVTDKNYRIWQRRPVAAWSALKW